LREEIDSILKIAGKEGGTKTMAYLFIGILLVVLILWGMKASANKRLSGTSYTPYDDMIAGKVNSHPPIEAKSDANQKMEHVPIWLLWTLLKRFAKRAADDGIARNRCE